MEEWSTLWTALPMLLAIGFFVLVVSLAKKLFASRESRACRRAQDRRQQSSKPPYPFYDCENRLVTEDRRMKPDRRKRQIYFITTRQEMNQGTHM